MITSPEGRFSQITRQILEYSLNLKNYLLDGELLEFKENTELVRMPLALISMEYLSRTFNHDNYCPIYNENESQASIVGEPIPPEDILLFDLSRLHFPQ